MASRREFFGAAAGVLGAGLAAGTWSPSARQIGEELAATRHASADDAARDEDFWAHVQQAFLIDRSLVNLNNGGVSPSPAFVLEAQKRHLDFSNTTPPPHSLWAILEPRKESVRAHLAKIWGADTEEIALTRNASESLQTCQLGLDLQRGDEVLTTTQDYPRMITTFKQRERREGIILKQIKIPVPAEDPAEVVRRFREAMTARTRLILMSHVVFLTGQILPVREVVAAARERDIPVIVDGAHAFSQFAFRLSDLACDYYGVSLHKWLHAPHGTGMLYVRKDKIKGLWPMMAADTKLDEDIRKFEEIGTHPAAGFLATAEALTFYEAIGAARKEARLRFLRDLWARRLAAHRSGRVKLWTSLRPECSCAIGTVSVDGLDNARLRDWLLNKKQILTTPIKHDEVNGLRVTASVYTTPEEVERFCEAVEWAIDKGLPAEDEKK
jgi:selenocysteine lyase/cysteine desulfurase